MWRVRGYRNYVASVGRWKGVEHVFLSFFSRWNRTFQHTAVNDIRVDPLTVTQLEILNELPFNPLCLVGAAELRESELFESRPGQLETVKVRQHTKRRTKRIRLT